MATLEEITEKVRRSIDVQSGFGKSFKLDLKGEGFIHVEGSSVTNDDKAADLTVRVSPKDLDAIAKGKLNPMTAAITGRMQISDMALAMSLMPQVQALFSRFA